MFESCLYFNMSLATRRLNKIWHQAFAEADLSAPHGYAMLALGEHPGMTPKELAQVLALDMSTITRFVDALIAKGLMTKTAHSDDKRKVQLQLTQVGEQRLIQLQGIANQLFNEVRQRIPSDQVEQAVQLSQTIARHLSPEDKP